MRLILLALWLVASGVAHAQDIGISPPTQASNTVVRGLGQGMRDRIATSFALGSAISNTYRQQVRTFVGFSRVRFIVPTFTVSGSADVPLVNDYRFSVCLEYPFTNAFTGIPTRQACSGTLNYVAASGRCYVDSGWITLTTPVVASSGAPATFGVWTTENQTEGLANLMMWQDYGANFFGDGTTQFEGFNFVAADSIASDFAHTSSSITDVGSAQAGQQRRFGPFAILIDYPPSAKAVTVFGHSIPHGTGENASGSGTSGSNTTGSAFFNSGPDARGVNEVLNLNYTKIALSGDTFANLATSSNWKCRQQLLSLANPTHVLVDLGTNDVNTGTGTAAIAANALTTNTKIRALVPGVKITQVTILPRTTGAWTLANGSDQTLATGQGGSASNRGVINDTYIKALSASWGNDAYWDVNPVAEMGYVSGQPATETGKWVANGSANFATGDGIHPNSAMDVTMANSMTQGILP